MGVFPATIMLGRNWWFGNKCGMAGGKGPPLTPRLRVGTATLKRKLTIFHKVRGMHVPGSQKFRDSSVCVRKTTKQALKDAHHSAFDYE